MREGERERDGDWVIKNHNITKQNKTKASDFCFSLVLGSVCMCGFLLIISLSLFWPYLSLFCNSASGRNLCKYAEITILFALFPQ